jgi:signal transduction histidine kinase
LLLLARSDAVEAPALVAAEPVRLDLVAQELVRTARGLATGQYLEVFAPTPVTVLGDADRLRQLLLALLDNALRHTPSGGQIVVEVAVDPTGIAIIEVADTGEGIAESDLPHVFERFYRADGARDRQTGGTGLGLAIARAIAEAHGGSIGVVSRPGDGANFTVRLPLAGTEHRPDQMPRISSQPTTPATTTNASGSETPRKDSRSNPSP